VEETVYDILLFEECNGGGPDDVMTVEEMLYKILLLGMSIGDGVAPSPARRTVELVVQATQFITTFHDQ